MDMSVDAYLAQLNVIQTHDTTDRLGAISVPTLVLAGEEDILIPVRLSKALHEVVPGAQWATYAGRPRLPVGAPRSLQPGPHRVSSAHTRSNHRRTP